jgi:hypothetical protein
MKIVMSSGHGLYIRGARGNPVPPQLDEVDQARRLCNRVAELLTKGGITTVVYHDDVSTTQDANLAWIVSHHNNTDSDHDYDLSFHFNAYDGKAHGTEVFSIGHDELAGEISEAIANAGGFTNRGAKDGSSLYFCNNTREEAYLLETCFCDHTGDSKSFTSKFENIAMAIADLFISEAADEGEPLPPVQEDQFYARGTCSWFGGPEDDGVSPSEGLAFFYKPEECPHLMLPEQPPGSTGMARRLDTDRVFYVACRWPYDAGFPKEMLRNQNLKALVRGNKREFYAFPADWGPHEAETGRAADLSLALMRALFDSDDATDEIVEVIYPAP